jgi:hypothetical protein
MRLKTVVALLLFANVLLISMYMEKVSESSSHNAIRVRQPHLPSAFPFGIRTLLIPLLSVRIKMYEIHIPVLLRSLMAKTNANANENRAHVVSVCGDETRSKISIK